MRWIYLLALPLSLLLVGCGGSGSDAGAGAGGNTGADTAAGGGTAGGDTTAGGGTTAEGGGAGTAGAPGNGPWAKAPAGSHKQLPGGLQYAVLKPGTGATAKSGQTVKVHYTGWLQSNGTKFDSSRDRGEPIDFPLGAGAVIPGWDQGVAGMKVGEQRQLVIPSELGYGAQGTPGGPIPPNANLIFDVELVEVSGG